ncbi:alpha-1,3-mannosyltransferase [Novosphingobium chloroacetimidivorans]|uniref:Alpha-1,3-mannosyltransferase n=1 Tax=Novosphingobium chloroacetimidivorans TaxID=1428314 RepID=A0A7W7KDQ6_9SPHN|nr:alpha-1,3-mannosyltransferase [Novosphingobium chloroacetimidivorans]
MVRQFAPMIGGLEDAVAQLVKHLHRDHSIDGSVVTLDRSFGDLSRHLPAVGKSSGIPIRRIPFIGSSRYPVAPGVLKKLGGADLIHVHGIDFFFDFLAATRFLHRRRLVASTHGGFFHTDYASRAKRIWFASITRVSASGYARIFGSSENDADIFRQIAPRQTIAIENGVDIDKWRDAGAREPSPTLLFIGRFAVNKDVPALIRLVAALGRPWQLIVAGQPSDLSVDDLRWAAAAVGATEQLEIHVGPDDAALRELVGRATYVASASRYEGFGLSVVEGMSAGLVPVLRRIPPFERLVETTGCGLLVDMDDPLSAAGEVQKFHNEQARARRAAAILAAARFGWTRVATRFAAEYRAVLGEKE